jgi:hypothetical protein
VWLGVLLLGCAPAAAGEVPISLSFTWSNFIGQGTVVPGPTHNPYWLSDLAITAAFALPWDFTLSLREEAWVEPTASDTTTTPWQPGMFDPMAILSWRGLRYRAWGLSSSIDLYATAPISLLSRRMGALGTVGIGLGGSWTVPWTQTTFSGGASALGTGFSAALADVYAAEVADPLLLDDGAEVQTKGCLRRTPQPSGAYVCGTLPTAGTTTASLAVSQSLFSGLVSFGGSGRWLTFYTGYLGPSDQFTSANARPGIGALHYSEGLLWASLAPLSWWSLEVGTWSFQPAFTTDGRLPRFPWWDIISMRSNYSTVYVATTVSF